MSETKTKRLHYQQRCVIWSLKHMAHSLGYLAMGQNEAAEMHKLAAQKWADTAIAAQEAINRGAKQWILDALWVEPEPLPVAEDED